jgi:major membrane immunogen (membrane-anchored lipoprotein)
MKKSTVIILALSLILTACKKSDSKLSQQIPGKWTGHRPRIMVVGSDGSWATKSSSDSLTNSNAGTWQIKRGIFIMTFTNDSMKGGTMYCKIIRVDDHQFIYENGGNLYTNNR